MSRSEKTDYFQNAVTSELQDKKSQNHNIWVMSSSVTEFIYAS